MSLHGKIVKLSTEQFGFETTSAAYDKPIQYRHVWPLVRGHTAGYSYCRADEAVGKDATSRDGRVHCYLGQGNSFDAEMPQGGATMATIFESIPVTCPKVRSGIETRWRDGQWQKLTRKGWIEA